MGARTKKSSGRRKAFAILTGILLAGLVLCFLAGKKGEPAQNFLTGKDQEEIQSAVRGGVEDNTWWEAKSKAELRQILARYYTEPLLEKISAESWAFIREPTDWYWQAQVKKMTVRGQRKGIVSVTAELELNDLITSRKDRGEAEFMLTKTREGWRIFSARYRWPENETGSRTGA